MRPGTIALHVGHMPEKVSKLVGMRINQTVAYFPCAYLGEIPCAYLGEVLVSTETDRLKLQLERFGE